MNQFLGSIALWPVEEILNQLLINDSFVASKLAPFKAKVIEINCSNPRLSITLQFGEDKLKLSAVDSSILQCNPDSIITGKASDLLQLLVGSEHRPLANTAVSIKGDAHLVQELYNTLNELDLDWADYLAPLLGDIVTNELGQFAEDARHWSSGAGKSIRRNVDEFLKEEAKVVPSRQQVDSFNSKLDRLKINIDRVKARVDQVQERLEKLTH